MEGKWESGQGGIGKTVAGWEGGAAGEEAAVAGQSETPQPGGRPRRAGRGF